MYGQCHFFFHFYYLWIIPVPHRLHDNYYVIYWSYTPYIITRASSTVGNKTVWMFGSLDYALNIYFD